MNLVILKNELTNDPLTYFNGSNFYVTNTFKMSNI